MQTRHLSWLLIAAFLLISTAPLYAQRQQQNVAKLKADARNLVGIIGSDKTKTQTYCQIEDLSERKNFATLDAATKSSNQNTLLTKREVQRAAKEVLRATGDFPT
jgi:hypothetical protein